jgi:trehalose 6-phosphate phosphatase
MERLFDNWRQVGLRLRAAGEIALFLDFDGTLARVRPRPDQVALDPATRRVLRRLAHSRRVRVCIISGRRLDDVRSRVRVPGVKFLGLHGWESTAGRKLNAPAGLLIEKACAEVERALRGLAGIWIEEKVASFAVHYRGVDSATRRQARQALSAVIEPLAGALRVLYGDQVWEVVPREVRGKGAAAQRRARVFRGALPVYAGNDGTDEPAFHALARGITIRVGRQRPSRARFLVRDPAEVRQFLERLLEEVQ